FSPDGTRVCTGSQDHTARLWDAATGQEKAILKGHTDHVMSVCFSRDGQRVLTGGMDGTARLLDAETGQEKVGFRGHTGAVVIACLSPDGKTVLTGSGLLYTASGQQTSKLGDGTARLWDAATGQQKVCLTPDKPVNPKKEDSGHEGSVMSVCFSPDGQYALTGGGNTARLWDAATGKEKVVFEALDQKRNLYIFGACFSPDGKRVLTFGADSPVRLWDATTGQQ